MCVEHDFKLLLFLFKAVFYPLLLKQSSLKITKNKNVKKQKLKEFLA